MEKCEIAVRRILKKLFEVKKQEAETFRRLELEEW